MPLTWADHEITLAQAANTIATFSSTFANNMVNPVLVNDGPLTIAANSFPGGSTPNAFGSMITFDMPYTYQGGDLVILITHSGSTGDVILDAIQMSDTAQGYGTLFTAAANPAFQAATAAGSTVFPVFQLEFTSVPEPSSFALVGLCTAGLFVYRRRKATQTVS